VLTGEWCGHPARSEWPRVRGHCGARGPSTFAAHATRSLLLDITKVYQLGADHTYSIQLEWIAMPQPLEQDARLFSNVMKIRVLPASEPTVRTRFIGPEGEQPWTRPSRVGPQDLLPSPADR
jgi:hypothetical protein